MVLNPGTSSELAGFDQRGDNRPVAAAAVRAGEESILAIEGDRANGTLDGVRVDLDPAVVEEPGQALLTRQRIADRLGELALLADERELGAQPRLEVGEDWARALLPSGAAFLRIATANVLLDRIQRGDALERLAVTIAAFASRQIQTLVPSISSSIEWGREIARSEGAACNEMRSPSAASTTAGTNGGASVLASNRRRASRRQANNCCGEIPCRRATSETTPGASEASIARGAAHSERCGIRRPFGSSRERRLQVHQFHVRRRGQRKMIGGSSGERRVVNGEIADQAAWPAEDAIQCENRSPRGKTQD